MRHNHAVRLATWNINGMRARRDFVLHWLDARRPDVVGLQELKMQDDKFPHAAFEEVGYTALTHGQKSWNGVAILTREPAEVLELGLPGQEDSGARLITAQTAGLRFTTVYCPNGKNLEHADFPRKLAWFEALREHLGGTLGGEDVVCGDFNICPEPIDSWCEEEFADGIFHTSEERGLFREVLGLGLVDVFRQRHPELQKFSWWDYRAGRFHKKQGLRIDFVLATESVMQRVRSVEVDRDYRKKQSGLTPSDHAPVIVDLD